MPDSGRPRGEPFYFRLYVNGMNGNSSQAVANLQSLLETQLPEQFDLEVLNIAENPEALDEDDVLATPTLIKKLPEPVSRLLGDFSNQDAVLTGMGLQPKAQT